MKMSFINICLTCLKNSDNLVLIETQFTNGTSIKDKLKYFLPELVIKSNFLQYICSKCTNDLSRSYKFKQKCLRNITTYEKYAQQITTSDGSNEYLSVADFVSKEEVSDGDDYDDSRELIIKEETDKKLILVNKLETALQNIDEENLQSGDTNNLESQTEINEGFDNREYIFIKEETNEKLILDNELKSLLRECKEENPESNDTCKQTKNNNEVPTLTEKEIKYNKEMCECKICNKSFECSRVLKQHLRTHSRKVFTCKVCGKSVRNLKKHNTIHSDERPHKCEICNKSFRILDILKQHLLVHTGEKPFTCEFCNKSFVRLSDLKNHKFTHSDEKQFTCEICNKSFRQFMTLHKHKLVHTGEKPYTCELCNKSFGRSSDMKNHKLIHTDEKPFTCEICCKSFRTTSNLNQHKLLHLGKDLYTCEICKKSYRQSHSLKKHKLVHIGENKNESV